MMKTKIVYNKVEDAKSIYDNFVDEDLFQKVYTYGHRHFKRDSFYHYSNPIQQGKQIKIGTKLYETTTGRDFINWFEKEGREYDTHDYWLKPDKEQEYTGYDDKLRNLKFLQSLKNILYSFGSKYKFSSLLSKVFRIQPVLFLKITDVFMSGMYLNVELS